jgi:pyrimidine-nucleoside phosphorylase
MHHLNPVEIIRKKRDGGVLNKEEILYFISAYLDGYIEDYQMSALLMAVYFQGINEEETKAFTEAFINSGETIDLSFIKKPKIDKHSTGGVGDKTSIILAPLIACFDVVVPMMSGRGLGHTGGTLDKLESIPGFKVHVSPKEFKEILTEINVCMIGQTDELVKADRKIYALRDVTATVENIGLITASIVSKKIAEGAEGIVYDVKIGQGANLQGYERSKALAQSLLKVTRDFGKKSIAVLTDMHEPLGYAIGNWVEIHECINIMNPETGKSRLSDDLIEVTLALAGAMLFLAGKCRSIKEGIPMAQEKLYNGDCYNKFLELVKKQGGDVSVIKNPIKYRKINSIEKFVSDKDGYISTFNAMKFGKAAVALGCGRKKITDNIDYSAGIILKKKPGDKVKAGDEICVIIAEDKNKLVHSKEFLNGAVEIGNSQIEIKSKILEIID